MKINLRSLGLVNFKGIAHFEVSFNHITSIWGDNATGKTTIFDAFLWLFFGKNSEDVSQFEVKRLDLNNRFVEKQESEVVAVIHVDGQEIEVKKVLRQKWVKRRGELKEEYNGDENIYYWNDVPLKETDFKIKIKAIVEETTFRLITNPFYFNNTIKWQDRRNILIDVAGAISNEEVFDGIITSSNKAQFNSLTAALNQGKSIEEFKKELSAKKKKIKDEAESIPSRIDEVKRGMPLDFDFDQIRGLLNTASEEYLSVQAALNDEVTKQEVENKNRAGAMRIYNKAVSDRQQKVFDLKSKLQNIYFDAKQQAKESGNELHSQRTSLEKQVIDKKLDKERYSNSIKQIQQQLTDKETALNSLREKYASEDEKELVFNETEFVCPSCHQALPVDNIEAKKEELTKNFNTDKVKKIESITAEANCLKNEIQNLNTRITNGNKTIVDITADIASLQTKLDAINEQLLIPTEDVETITERILAGNKKYVEIKKEIADQEAIVFTEPESTPLQTNEELKIKSRELNDKVISLQKELTQEDILKKCQARIKELTAQENTLAQQLVDLEGTEYAIQQFTKAKVETIERRINGKFSFVKFKMFNQQVNGGESEACETLVNSNGSFVPFPDANNAAKINAGIDIINTMCKHYNVYAPIFIDNRESVTRLIDSDSQIVNLIVNEADKKLRVA